jgi:hypothetical protein
MTLDTNLLPRPRRVEEMMDVAVTFQITVRASGVPGWV